MLDKILSLFGGGILTGVSEIIGRFIEDPTLRAKIEGELLAKEAEYRRLLLEAETTDRASARQREMSVRDTTPRNLAYFYTAGYFSVLLATWHWGIPTDGHDVFVTLLGVLSAAQAGVVSYYFGSSHGSDKKTTLLDRVVTK